MKITFLTKTILLLLFILLTFQSSANNCNKYSRSNSIQKFKGICIGSVDEIFEVRNDTFLATKYYFIVSEHSEDNIYYETVYSIKNDCKYEFVIDSIYDVHIFRLDNLKYFITDNQTSTQKITNYQKNKENLSKEKWSYQWLSRLVLPLIVLILLYFLIRKVDSLKTWIISRSNKFIQRTFIIICFGMLFIRFFNEDFRIGFDALALSLLLLGVFAILKPEIKELIKQMKVFGLHPALAVATSLIEELEEDISKIEQRRSITLSEELNDDFINEIDSLTGNSEQDLLKFEEKIKYEIRKITKVKVGEQIKIPYNYEQLIIFAKKHKTIPYEFIELVEKFWKLKDNVEFQETPGFLKRLQRIAIKIIQTLRDFFKKTNKSVSANLKLTGFRNPQKVAFDKFQFIDCKKDKVSAIMSVSIYDENGNKKSPKDLSPKDFDIHETIAGTETKINILNIKAIKSNEVPLNIIICIDMSGSMNGTRIINAKKAAKVFIDNIEKTDSRYEIGVLPFYFHDEISNVSLLKFENTTWSSDSDELTSKINELTIIPKSGTPLWSAINNAHNEIIKKDGYKLIICISDGEGHEKKEFINKVKSKFTNKPISLIAVICKDENLSRDTFKELINISNISNQEQFGKSNFIINDASELTDIFTEISDDVINSYRVDWQSSSVNKNDLVDVIINLKYNREHLDFSDNYNAKYRIE